MSNLTSNDAKLDELERLELEDIAREKREYEQAQQEQAQQQTESNHMQQDPINQTQHSNRHDQENIEMHSAFDEKALLDSLDDDFNPDAAVESKSEQERLLEQGAMTATAVLGVSEQMIKQFGHKQFAFNPEQAEGVANAAAPLFVKYGGELPPWLTQYKEEIAFTMAAGALSFSSYAQIKALKQMDKAKEVQQAQAQSQGETQFTQAHSPAQSEVAHESA